MKNCWFLFIAGGLVGCNGNTLSTSQMEQLSEIVIGNGLAIHPSGLLILISKPSGAIDADTGREFYRIYQSSWTGESWSEPALVSFNSRYMDYHPVFSPDGKWVYFISNRPPPDSLGPTRKMNIWRVAFDPGFIGEAEFLYDINTTHHESYPTVTSDGTLYFNSDRPGGKGSMDIYSSSVKDGRFQPPVAVAVLNTSDSENDLAVDSKGAFMILNRYHFDTNEISLYQSRQTADGWSDPSFLHRINQPNVWELTPTLSPDGSFLFYEVEGKIQYVKLDDR